MSMNNSWAAYPDCLNYFNQALASERGVRIEVETPGKGRKLASRLNYFRMLDREKMKEIYPAREDPNHGKSPFDPLAVSSTPIEEDGKFYITISKLEQSLPVESL